MENNDQNNLSAPLKENPATDSAISTQNASPQIKTANLDQKRDELLSSGQIKEEVLSYLNELGEENYPPLAENTSTPREEEKNTVKQSIVRTFKSDAEEAIKTERMSSVSIVLAEEKRRQKYQTALPSDDAPKSKKILLFIISLLFVFAGIGAFNFNYIKEKVNVAPPTKKALRPTPLLTADSNSELNLSDFGKKDAGNFLSKFINTADIESNSIQNIYIAKTVLEKEKETKKLVETKEFLPLISSKIPDILFRSLSPEYMLGIHSWNGNQPFIILKTESYENAFAGMLSWEKNIAGDLSALFPRNIPPLTQEETATTEQVLSYKKDFEDVLVKNKDARALKDENGDIFLIYSLPDKETVIITSNTATLAELLDRLTRSRTVRQ